MVRNNRSPLLTGQYIVELIRQPGLLFAVEEHLVASGRQALPLTGVADLEPGDLFEVTHAPLLHLSLVALQYDGQTTDHPPGQPATSQVSAVTGSSLTVMTAGGSPSPALPERLKPIQRSSFLRLWRRRQSYLREVELGLHDPDWTSLAIEQLGGVLLQIS